MRIKDDYLEKVLAGQETLLFDGAMGTMLQRAGVDTSHAPELLCISNPQVVTDIHRAYVEAGSQAVTTNTFGANRFNLGDAETIAQVFAAAVKCARDAGAHYVAADVGPLGQFLDPYGDLEYEEAVELFAEQGRAIAATDADLVIVETMMDVQEALAAIEGIRATCDLPVFATMTFADNGRTMMGATPADEVEELEDAGVDALGVNCSLGPQALRPIVSELLVAATVPVIMQANAGLPEMVDGKPVYTMTPEAYAAEVAPSVTEGVRILGACCGTTPDFIAQLAKLL